MDLSSDCIYAVGDDGLVIRFDGDKSGSICHWEEMHKCLDLTESHLLSIFGFGEDNIFVGGADGTMLHFDGVKWNSMDLNGRWANKEYMGSLRQIDVFAVATDGRILHYNGKEWSVEETEKLPPMTGIFGLSQTEIYACAHVLGGFFAMTAMNGNFCKLQEPKSTLPGCGDAAESGMYAVGYDGLILHQEGEQWKRLTINSNHEFYGFCGFGPDDMYICGSDGIIYKFNGNVVTEMPTRTQDFFLDVWGPSKEMVFAVGDLGMIMFNDGEQWIRIESGTEEYLTAIWGSSDEDMYAVGDNGLILHWNGENWSACA